jgi:hypothetical protein
MPTVIIIIFIIIAFYVYRSYAAERARKAADEARKERIYQKYGHTEIADRIINKTVWVGETSEQLADSLGQPLDIDEAVLKTKKKETWKYYRKSANRYGFKITVENGVVIGWDEKL